VSACLNDTKLLENFCKNYFLRAREVELGLLGALVFLERVAGLGLESCKICASFSEISTALSKIFSRLSIRASSLSDFLATSAKLSPPFALGWIGSVAIVNSSLIIFLSVFIHQRETIIKTVEKAIKAPRKTEISPISKTPGVPGSHQ